MKKLYGFGVFYTAFALAAGVFFREFTKFNGFIGRTALAFVHPHLFFLGALVLIALAFAEKNHGITKLKPFNAFFVVYNIGLLMTAVLMLLRGVLDVTAPILSSGFNAAVSGIAGIGHILLGTGIVLLLVILKKALFTQKA